MTIIDSNVWIAFFHRNDSFHDLAVETLFRIQKEEKLIITEYCLLEVSTVLQMRAGHRVAQQFLERIQDNQDIEILYSSELQTKEVMQFFQKHNFEKLSFVDQSLLVLSKKHTIITFDQNLKKALGV